jgi:hypothetical protein
VSYLQYYAHTRNTVKHTMRTKTLLLTAALSAAGVATSMAQVYSQNAVGYVNITANPGFNLVANPLSQTAITVADLLPSPPPLTSVFKLVGSGFIQTTYDTDLNPGVGWDDPSVTLVNGGGFFLYNPSLTTPFTVTFVGEVPQGTLVNTISAAGFSMRSSMVPQAGRLTAELGYPPHQLDSVYTYVGGGFTQYTFDTDLNGPTGWDEDPPLTVGQAFYLNASGPNNWTRVFSVNP